MKVSLLGLCIIYRYISIVDTLDRWYILYQSLSVSWYVSWYTKIWRYLYHDTYLVSVEVYHDTYCIIDQERYTALIPILKYDIDLKFLGGVGGGGDCWSLTHLHNLEVMTWFLKWCWPTFRNTFVAEVLARSQVIHSQCHKWVQMPHCCSGQ